MKTKFKIALRISVIFLKVQLRYVAGFIITKHDLLFMKVHDLVIKKLYYKLNDINYNYRFISPRKEINGNIYRSYNLLNESKGEPLLNRIIEDMESNDVFFDIGGYRGAYTLAVAAAIDNVIIHTFEPHPISARQCWLNITLNDLQDSVSIHETAIAGEDGVSKYRLNSSRARSSLNFEPSDNIERAENIADVTQRSLDSMISSSLSIPDHIKIDAEGSELDIINGSKYILSKYKPNIYLEVHDIDLDKLHNTISTLDYSIEVDKNRWICYPN